MTNTAGNRGYDVPFEELRSAPDWRPFVNLIDGWFRQPLSADTGFSARHLKRMEKESGRPLPAVLREWYRLFGRHESLRDETRQDYEMPLQFVWSSPRYLRIYGECQDVWTCVVLEEHRDQPDPPVYFHSNCLDSVTDLKHSPDELVDGHFIPPSR